MIVFYCDRCKKVENQWKVQIISTKWLDDSGNTIAELCTKCYRELVFWIDPKKYKKEYGAFVTTDKFSKENL
jgi:hypothetical protein